MNVKSVPILNIPQNMILSIFPYCILNRASWIKIQVMRDAKITENANIVGH